MVFVGSIETKDNESVPLPATVEGLITGGVKIIPVGMGNGYDPVELMTIASDPRTVFPQDAVEPLKNAVKNAALPPVDGGFPGKMAFPSRSNFTYICIKKCLKFTS